ncbi:uncharacterized protein RAG0_14235 [Rhynchosporium agropyri]|nr:uncharacterized protein RAG0_14235 [Rhynchosporium agropyri]
MKTLSVFLAMTLLSIVIAAPPVASSAINVFKFQKYVNLTAYILTARETTADIAWFFFRIGRSPAFLKATLGSSLMPCPISVHPDHPHHTYCAGEALVNPASYLVWL